MAQAIVTKYFGPTNTKGSRIQVKSWFGTKYYSFDHMADCAHRAAFNDWLKEINAKMAIEHSNCQEALEGNWYKFVAKGAHPDGSGYCFIIK